MEAEDGADSPEEVSGRNANLSPGLLLAFITGLFLLVAGGLSLQEDFRELRRFAELDEYVEVPGVLLKVEVREDSLSAGDWYPQLIYEYFVDSRSIWGWRFNYVDRPQTLAYWQERLAALSVGDTVTVFYNPRDPKDAVLEKQHEGVGRPVAKMSLGLAFIAVGALLTGTVIWHLLRMLWTKRRIK